MKKENQHQEWPDAPEHLSEKAKTLFSFYIGRTVRSPGQVTLFIRGLEEMDVADECGRLIRENGLVQMSERSQLLRQNPLFNTQRESTALMLKIWKALELDTNMQIGALGLYEDVV